MSPARHTSSVPHRRVRAPEDLVSSAFFGGSVPPFRHDPPRKIGVLDARADDSLIITIAERRGRCAGSPADHRPSRQPLLKFIKLDHIELHPTDRGGSPLRSLAEALRGDEQSEGYVHIVEKACERLDVRHVEATPDQLAVNSHRLDVVEPGKGPSHYYINLAVDSRESSRKPLATAFVEGDFGVRSYT